MGTKRAREEHSNGTSNAASTSSNPTNITINNPLSRQMELDYRAAQQARASNELERTAKRIKDAQIELDRRSADIEARQQHVNNERQRYKVEHSTIERRLAQVIENERELERLTTILKANREKHHDEYETQIRLLASKRSELEHSINESFKQRTRNLTEHAKEHDANAKQSEQYYELAIAAADRAQCDALNMCRSLPVTIMSTRPIINDSNHSSRQHVDINRCNSFVIDLTSDVEDKPRKSRKRDREREPAVVVNIENAVAVVEEPPVEVHPVDEPVVAAPVELVLPADDEQSTLSWLQSTNVASADYAPHLIRMMQLHRNNAPIQLLLLQTLRKIERHVEETGSLVISLNGLKPLMGVVRSHGDDEAIQIAGLRLLGQIAPRKAHHIHSVFLMDNGLSLIVSAMKKHRESHNLLHEAVKFLVALADSASGKKSLLKGRVAQLSIDALAQHKASSYVAHRCLRLLAVMSELEDVVSVVVQHSGVARACEAMQALAANEKVQLAGCQLLVHVAPCSLAVDEMNGPGTLNVIIAAMKLAVEKRDVELAEAAVCVIASMSELNTKAKPYLVDRGFVELTLEAMERHPDHVVLHLRSCEVLVQLDAAQRIMSVGGCDIVTAALTSFDNYPQSRDIQNKAKEVMALKLPGGQTLSDLWKR